MHHRKVIHEGLCYYDRYYCWYTNPFKMIKYTFNSTSYKCQEKGNHSKSKKFESFRILEYTRKISFFYLFWSVHVNILPLFLLLFVKVDIDWQSLTLLRMLEIILYIHPSTTKSITRLRVQTCFPGIPWIYTGDKKTGFKLTLISSYSYSKTTRRGTEERGPERYPGDRIGRWVRK